jgi:penicillin-binding protein 1A
LACNSCFEDDALNLLEVPISSEDAELKNDMALSPAELFNKDNQAVEKIKQANKVISAQNAFLITQALNSAIWGSDWSIKPGWQGTGWRARTLKRRDIAGKTGTTNEAKDAWFSGFNKQLVTTSWIGFDDPGHILGKTVYNSNLGKNQTTGTEFGAKSAQPAWIDLMRIALEDIKVDAFQPPVDIVSVRIDKATGKLTTKTDKSSRLEYFRLGNVPTEYVTQGISTDILSGDNKGSEDEEELF